MDVDESNTSSDAAVGGAMRSGLRSMVMRLRLQNPIVGSFPRTVPVKAVASASDNLSLLMDVTGYVKEAKEQLDQHRSPQAKVATLTKWAMWTWVPNLVRSSLLGSATWASYELSTNALTPSQTPQNVVACTFGVALVAGGVAGALHGSLWTATEELLMRIKQTATSGYNLRGVLLSHTTTHVAMFSTYEGTKATLLESVVPSEHKEDRSAVVTGACIVAAAATSGLVGEVATHYIAPFEQAPFNESLKEAAALARPTLRGMAPSAFSTLLGWLAYEFAKDMVDDATG
ncbi:hypothetical protein SPRG_12283 [Saprolegnia parasitica CBS 223.65]|uniref:Uncharacterized protein n=1 Tax=Saprolegnia parasitica (strain CBS 223.65) TaxID=695850 RepID=A0A067BVW6_SAPPC|nr:hypothetical protein SPRG_12283 [Saprolegnia parasitica CBS 223.65]KDO22654.1 hypothetical protein SPRG_12283 [Saprolegnia parasitica CBS 223.65]|eukprot:XP_012206661.1 hypothetical protein SPRG_12283 [Saprolegnia parasitica CBS 223.65]